MPRQPISQYLNPWARRRDRLQQRVAALRTRDGDDCRRCRRPLQFDLPTGHDRAPTIQQFRPAAAGQEAALEELCLCHVRCNAEAGDDTAQVLERAQARTGPHAIAAE